jgi:peptidylprolyl isomerase
MTELAIEKDDLVYIDYVGKVKETRDIFDTTIEEEARKAESFREDQVYEPVLVAVGSGWMVKGLEEALIGKEVGQEFTEEIPPSKGYGERDPRKIVLYTRRKLLEAGIRENLMPGMTVDINGLPAVVRAAGGGRALLDFNLPLAGKTLIYDVKIRSICDTLDKKVRALVKRRYRAIAEKKDLYRYTKKTKTLQIYISEGEMMEKDLQLIKKGVAGDIFRFIPEVEKIEFIEEIVRPHPPEEEKEEGKEGEEAKPKAGGEGEEASVEEGKEESLKEG